MSDIKEESILIHYQTIRHTVSNFDTILVTLLTQGNTFVIGILSVPFIANMKPILAAAITFFALLLGLFFLFANWLYLSFLKGSVQLAQRWESRQLANLPEDFQISLQLEKIPLSAGKGSKVLYLGLPSLLVLSAIGLGSIHLLDRSWVWSIGYMLLCLSVIMASYLVYRFFLKRV